MIPENVSVQVTVGQDASSLRPHDPIARLMLRIPNAWLEKWGMPINSGAAVFTVTWTVFVAAASIFGLLRRWGITSGQTMALSLGWVPVMTVNMLLIAARSTHTLVWLDAQSHRLREIDEGLAGIVAQAVHEGMTRAMAGEDPPADRKGPTIQ